MFHKQPKILYAICVEYFVGDVIVQEYATKAFYTDRDFAIATMQAAQDINDAYGSNEFRYFVAQQFMRM